MGASAETPLAVLTSRVRGDDKRILAALDHRGVAWEHVDARTLWRTLDEDAPMPWRAAINRELSHSRGLYAALILEARGLPVMNSAAAFTVCGDKWRTSVALHAAGLPTPRTALALTPETALEAIETLGCPIVLKPLVGSWGRRVALIRDVDEARTVLEYCAALPSPLSHLIYLQEAIDKPGRDIRAIVVGGEPLGAVFRYSSSWRTNVARGARTAPCRLPDVGKLAIDAARATGAEIAGVDLLEDSDGRLYVLEVNQSVEFGGFEAGLGESVDVAAAIVDYALARVS